MSLTRNRNLRDGQVVWASYARPTIAGRRLERSTHADVVVVGAGISGAMIAESLTDAGKRLLIVDRRRSALLGSTAASTALLQFELDPPLTAWRSAAFRGYADYMSSIEFANGLHELLALSSNARAAIMCS